MSFLQRLWRSSHRRARGAARCAGKAAVGDLFTIPCEDASGYGADDQYTKGWDAGFEECRADMAAMVLHARLRNPSHDD